jgi:hypothetical protein
MISAGKKHLAFETALVVLKKTFFEAPALLKFSCREFLLLLSRYPDYWLIEREGVQAAENETPPLSNVAGKGSAAANKLYITRLLGRHTNFVGLLHNC